MVTSRRLAATLASGGFGLLLTSVLVTALAAPASAQPGEVPDSGVRPAPAGEVPLPDGSSARFPADPDPMAGPLAGEIAATEARIAAAVQRLGELEPQLEAARQERERAEAEQQQARSERTAARQALDELVREAYRELAAVPEALRGIPLPDLAGTAEIPTDPMGGEAAGRALRRAEQVAASAEQAYQAAVAAEQALAAEVSTEQGRLAALQTQLETLRDENAALLARQEAAEQRRAAERSYPLQESVAGLRAHPLAQQAVRFALGELGKPYQWGAEGPDRYDCSGLMWAAYRSVGVTLPRVAADQFRATAAHRVAERALLPGDLLFFSHSRNPADIHHVGMYVGDGRMVHAPNRNDVVKVSQVWWPDVYAATRVVEAVRVSEPSPSPGDPSAPPGITPPTIPPPGGGTQSPPPGTGTPSPAPTTVRVPDLTGMMESQARDALTAVLLVPTEGSAITSGSCEVGRVAGQDPPPGTEVLLGTSVTYQVCALEVPDIVGLAEDEVAAAVGTGFQVEVEYVVAEGVPFGTVVRTEPPAGELRFARGTVVVVYVSGIQIPSVVGDEPGTATATLNAAGIEVVEVVEADPGTCPQPPADPQPGTVACQHPAAGTVVGPTTVATLTVVPSASPSPSPTPSGTESPAPTGTGPPAGGDTTTGSTASASGYLPPRTLLWQGSPGPVAV